MSFLPSSYFCLQVAFGPNGSPSKALLGFCKKNGVQADTVFTEADSKGTEYVWAVVKQPGRATAEVCNESSNVFCKVLLLLLTSTLCMLLLLVFTLCNPVEVEYDFSYHLLQAQVDVPSQFGLHSTTFISPCSNFIEMQSGTCRF